MGLVTDDLRKWLAESDSPETESSVEANPFRWGGARAAQAHVDSHMREMWHRLTCRFHKWLHHGDGLTR